MRDQRSTSAFDRRLIGMGILGLIAVGIFLVVQFVDIGSLGKQDEGEDEVDALPASEDILFANAGFGTVNAISIEEHSTGTLFQASADADGVWTIEEAPEGSDTGLGVDEPRLSGALTSLPSLRPTRTLSEVEAVATYGLSEPAYTIWFNVIDAGNFLFEVGSTNPDATGYYVQVPGRSGTVYLVSTFNIDPLIEFVTDPPFIQPVEGEGTPEGTPVDTLEDDS